MPIVSGKKNRRAEPPGDDIVLVETTLPLCIRLTVNGPVPADMSEVITMLLPIAVPDEFTDSVTIGAVVTVTVADEAEH